MNDILLEALGGIGADYCLSLHKVANQPEPQRN